ncbi:SUF system Fe-S cluster assembly regulator [Photobacterium sp. SDRW27]|uniref:SUF system Fe-S cluster assembly regulator n=1 Tax=Photobacterium obscurum TaxID=2829490 RepID=UPI002244F1AE|nr:SUF system Fe-S cluster assembly regulator [Photobacterium obscurum]MCW8331428.1 SUF system Fe-S cluster assembly regulator [Photobacterium obscurum]
MLRVSKLTDYGSVLMSYMARHPEQIFSTACLARAVYLPPTTVSKLLKILHSNGLVLSTRGKNGGYRLAFPAQQITLAQIVNALEGKVAITECSVKEGLCHIEDHCEIRDNWRGINRVIYDSLSQVTLQDMLSQESTTEPLTMTE